MQSLQDPFVGELIGTIQMETEENGYYVMLIGGESIQNVVDIASKWNVEGFLILGYNEEQYRTFAQIKQENDSDRCLSGRCLYIPECRYR